MKAAVLLPGRTSPSMPPSGVTLTLCTVPGDELREQPGDGRGVMVGSDPGVARHGFR